MFRSPLAFARSSTQHRCCESDSSPGSVPALCCTGVDAHYGNTLALDGISLSIESSTVTAVVGANGSGKSTLFSLISGRRQATAGRITTSGAVAEVLQGTAIDADTPLTVNDIVTMGRYPSRGLLRPMRRVDRDAIDDALERVDLIDLRNSLIGELSGGQRQRALIAQGIVQLAPLLILDEPAAGLDAPSQQHVLDIIRAEADRGRTVIFSTHQLSEAAHADTIIALACKCVCCAPAQTALADPAIAELFV